MQLQTSVGESCAYHYLSLIIIVKCLDSGHNDQSLLRDGEEGAWRALYRGRITSSTAMKSKILSSVILEDFLDASPKPAFVLKSHTQLLSADSLKVVYANRAFLDIIGDGFLGMGLEGIDAESSDDLTSLLQAKCVQPTMSRFVKWIDTVLLDPNTGYSLRTSFQGAEVTTGGTGALNRQVVNVEWDAVVLLKTFVVLTGKLTGTALYFTGEKSALEQPRRPSLRHLPSHNSHRNQAINEPNENLSDISAFAINVVTPGSNRSSIGGEFGEYESTSPTNYFTEGFVGSTQSSPKGLDPWRHHEKVIHSGTAANGRF